MIAAVAAAALAIAAWWLFLYGRLETHLFVASTRRSRRMFWIVKAWVLFAGTSLVVLMLVGRPDAMVVMPREFGALAVELGLSSGAEQHNAGFYWAMAGGLCGGAVVGALIGWWRKRRGKRQIMLGDVSKVLPADRSELPLSAALAVTAGITEELFFRLAVPLAITDATTSPIAGPIAGPITGFAVATLMFVAAHRYQRWQGMAGALVLGLLFAGIYIATGSIVAAIAVHAAIDLNSMVVRPWLMGLPRR